MVVESLKVAAMVSLMIAVCVGLLITCIDTIFDSSLKDIITGRAVVTFAKKIWNGFSLKFFAFVWLVGTLIFWLPVRDECDKLQKEKIGACTCNCKTCQETAKKVDAAIQYLGLDEEDIEDLILQKKAEKVEAKEVAIPTVK